MQRDDQSHVTATELRILEALWEHGAGTIRELLAARPDWPWAYTTVQTLLHRMQDRGLVSREGGARAAVYAAAVTRDELVRRQVGDIADRLTDGAVLPLFQGLVAGRGLEPEEIQQLRQMLDDLESGPQTRSRQKRRKT